MPKKCSVCQGPRRAQLEAVFWEGYSVGYVMMRFPGLTRARLERHRPHSFGPPDAPPPAQLPASRGGASLLTAIPALVARQAQQQLLWSLLSWYRKDIVRGAFFRRFMTWLRGGKDTK